MNIPFRKTLAATVLFVLGAAGCIAADELPSGKPIAIIVGFVAGGASDTSTRMVARKVSENSEFQEKRTFLRLYKHTKPQ